MTQVVYTSAAAGSYLHLNGGVAPHTLVSGRVHGMEPSPRGALPWDAFAAVGLLVVMSSPCSEYTDVNIREVQQPDVCE